MSFIKDIQFGSSQPISHPHSIYLEFAGKKMSKQEDLKEMGDISSGMSSSIMQLYLKQVLESFFHTQSSVRHFALNVIALTLNQGLIHPVQVCIHCTNSPQASLKVPFSLISLFPPPPSVRSISYRHGNRLGTHNEE